MRKAAKEVLQQVCGGCAVDEDDGRFCNVLFREQQYVEVLFLVHDVY